MGVVRFIFVLFFVLNALFWGLWPHSAHCRMAAVLGASTCAPHIAHVSFGVVFFIVAVLIAQWGMF